MGVDVCGNCFVASGCSRTGAHFGWFKTGEGKRHPVGLATPWVRVPDDRKVNATEPCSTLNSQYGPDDAFGVKMMRVEPNDYLHANFQTHINHPPSQRNPYWCKHSHSARRTSPSSASRDAQSGTVPSDW